MSTDVNSLPEKFAELPDTLPEGILLSGRVLDPVVIIDKENGKLVAKMAGRRRVKGKEKLIFAFGNQFDWVLDDKTIRPLPRDAAELLEASLDLDHNGSVGYGQLRQYIASSDGSLSIQQTEAVEQSGTESASRYPDELRMPGLNADLYPYQAKGVAWMWETVEAHGGLILADEMGLGKTLQIIALLVKDPPSEQSPALIICPTSLIANWVREIERFAPSLSIQVHRGAYRTGVFTGLQCANVVITTYDTMVNDISIFSAFEWSWVICDEAQAIKNPASGRRTCVSSIPRARTVPMTGTPVENSLVDLWSLSDFAIPGILGTLSDFEVKFPDGIETAAEVAKIVEPIMLKRRVADVADDLPERMDIEIPLEMESDLVEHYNAVREDTLAKYPVAGALVATLQLQLVCAHPWLRVSSTDGTDTENANIVEDIALPLINTKMEQTLRLIREAFATGRKILVFALFNRLGELLQRAAPDLSDAYWGAINGGTAQADRQGIIDEFSAVDGPAILVLNPKAAGAGLNITAATVVIHMTPVWNPALEAQASARAHRRGQTMPVTIYHLYYEDTVERIMLDRSAWKNKMGNEIAPVSTRDDEDLRSALNIRPQLP
ncbi:DEAD/DEAH box helicase [Tropicimonas sp. TH_r6]|uniref:DEAD/DEAH box helicase n=1 Tax=Tropicimonas sp. TH_r6 TaxID=3082085 RepID=UPI002954BCF6|nr:DEAD/DEAH box helicase [Tropicimonas sp. TH_r6]MDV7141766.1 DEAD/DEAH box helicase [Tropicimonas sp. TH_r6]